MITSALSQVLAAPPELAAWSLMIVGFSLAGQMLRAARGFA